MAEKDISRRHILIIEDDREISGLLEIHLKDLGFRILKAFDGLKGLDIIKTHSIDLIILDIILPGLSGFDICKEIRKMDKYIPILMLTAKTDEIDKVLGLEFGADDYLTKPFSIRELTAWVKALYGRVKAINQDGEKRKDIDFGHLKIEAENKKVVLDGHRVEVTPKEFELLYLLASHPGRTYTRNDLLDLN